MSTKKARSTLTLKKMYELIDVAKKNPHLGSWALAEKFGCGLVHDCDCIIVVDV